MNVSRTNSLCTVGLSHVNIIQIKSLFYTIHTHTVVIYQGSKTCKNDPKMWGNPNTQLEQLCNSITLPLGSATRWLICILQAGPGASPAACVWGNTDVVQVKLNISMLELKHFPLYFSSKYKFIKKLQPQSRKSKWSYELLSQSVLQGGSQQTDRKFCKCFGKQKIVSQSYWAINSVVVARSHYPAVLIPHYSNWMVLYKEQYGFKSECFSIHLDWARKHSVSVWPLTTYWPQLTTIEQCQATY